MELVNVDRFLGSELFVPMVVHILQGSSKSLFPVDHFVRKNEFNNVPLKGVFMNKNLKALLNLVY